jgi:alanine racemase
MKPETDSQIETPERMSDSQKPFINPKGRPTRAEINLDNLVHNFLQMREETGKDVAVMPAMKADAYGHGAIRCARVLEQAGADWFGVALPEEGLKLRAAAIRTPILCLSGFWEGQEDLLLRERMTPTIFRVDLLEKLDRAAQSANVIADYHLKIDTGMGRLGVPWTEVGNFLHEISSLKNVRLDGVMSHFATADEPEKESFTIEQMSRFDNAINKVLSFGHRPHWIHQANSAATHAYPNSRNNLVRPGGIIYGLWQDVVNLTVPPLDWRPVMSLHTQINFVKTVAAGIPLGYGGTFVTERESRIATLSIGYEDGLRRRLSNRGRVIVRGKYAPIVGRISMDLTMIDVTDIPDAKIGDDVVIIGRQGASEITAADIGETLGTISYEVICGISERVPRVYVGTDVSKG